MDSEWEKSRKYFLEADKWLRERGIIKSRKDCKDSPRPWVCPKCQKFEGTLNEVQEHQSHCDPNKKEDDKESNQSGNTPIA